MAALGAADLLRNASPHHPISSDRSAQTESLQIGGFILTSLSFSGIKTVSALPRVAQAKSKREGRLCPHPMEVRVSEERQAAATVDRRLKGL